MYSAPDYEESWTSTFTEEFRLTRDFCQSISGIVRATPVDSLQITRFEAVGVISGCRTRLRDPRLSSDAGLVLVLGG